MAGLQSVVCCRRMRCRAAGEPSDVAWSARGRVPDGLRGLRGLRRKPMFYSDSGPRAGPLFHETQAYLRRPAKPLAPPVKLDGLRFGASTHSLMSSMHTVVFGWFGGSAVWFIPLLWRLVKSVLPGGAGLRGPGTIRLWLGFLCVIVASCTLEASLLSIADVNGLGRALAAGFGHLLGHVGTPLA